MSPPPALRGAPDLFQGGPLRVFQIAACQQHVAVPGDHGEQVVEIVRHAAGQPADRLHFLGLPELLFQGDALVPRLHGANLPLDRRAQPHQVGSRDVVGGPGFEDRQHLRILEFSRDDDQGQVDAELVDDAAGRPARQNRPPKSR